MFFPFGRNPGIYYISLTVKNRQRCALQFRTRSQVCLFDGNGSRFILEFTGILCCLDILPLVRSVHLDCLIRGNISGRRFLLPDVILPERQVHLKDGFSILSCCRFTKQYVCIYDGFPIYSDGGFRI